MQPISWRNFIWRDTRQALWLPLVLLFLLLMITLMAWQLATILYFAVYKKGPSMLHVSHHCRVIQPRGMYKQSLTLKPENWIWYAYCFGFWSVLPIATQFRLFWCWTNNGTKGFTMALNHWGKTWNLPCKLTFCEQTHKPSRTFI